MIRRLLMWLTARLPVKVIGRTAPYVEWYHVYTLERELLLQAFGCTLLRIPAHRCQINRFVRSDPDGVHDHPWGWARTFILWSWYFEERRDRTRVRSAGQTYGLTGDTFHRVILPELSDCWTLFFHGPYVKHWGFLTPARTPGNEASWNTMRGGEWRYVARPRHSTPFDNWHLTAPKGREIREAA